MKQTLTLRFCHTWDGVCWHAGEHSAHELQPEKQGARSGPNTGWVILGEGWEGRY